MNYLGLYQASANFEHDVSNWLYGSYNESKYNQFASLYAIPVIRQYFDYLLDKRRTSEYMNRNQLSYSDIHDPRKLYTTGSVGSMVNFVSSNVKKLYD